MVVKMLFHMFGRHTGQWRLIGELTDQFDAHAALIHVGEMVTKKGEYIDIGPTGAITGIIDAIAVLAQEAMMCHKGMTDPDAFFFYYWGRGLGAR
jgi:hypothetical protein